MNMNQQKDIGGTKIPSVDQGKSPASTATKAVSELAAKHELPPSPGHDVDAISKPIASVEDTLKGGPEQVGDLLGSGPKEPASIIDGVPKVGDGIKKTIKKPSDIYGFPKAAIDKVKKGPEAVANTLKFGSKEPGDLFKGSPQKDGSGSESNGPVNIFRGGIESVKDGLGSGSKEPANIFGEVSKGVVDQKKEKSDELGGIFEHESKDSANVFGGGVKQAEDLFSGNSGGLDTFWR